jgi:hypothetical protein
MTRNKGSRKSRLALRQTEPELRFLEERPAARDLRTEDWGLRPLEAETPKLKSRDPALSEAQRAERSLSEALLERSPAECSSTENRFWLGYLTVKPDKSQESLPLRGRDGF